VAPIETSNAISRPVNSSNSKPAVTRRNRLPDLAPCDADGRHERGSPEDRDMPEIPANEINSGAPHTRPLMTVLSSRYPSAEGHANTIRIQSHDTTAFNFTYALSPIQKPKLPGRQPIVKAFREISANEAEPPDRLETNGRETDKPPSPDSKFFLFEQCSAWHESSFCRNQHLPLEIDRRNIVFLQLRYCE
jgi:hypothetical protein